MRLRVKKRVRFSAVVTRADGTVEDYGTIMDTRWGPLRRWLAKRRIEKLNRERSDCLLRRMRNSADNRIGSRRPLTRRRINGDHSLSTQPDIRRVP